MDDWPDIPTALTKAESIALEMLAIDNRVLEVGALLGYSTVVMARVACQVVSVDPHQGYPERDPKPTLDEYLNNLERYGVIEKVVPVIGTIEKAGEFLDPEMFSLVFLDLTGRYEDTFQAMMNINCLHGGGVLAVHDCGHPEWPGVQQAVQEFSKLEKIEPMIVDRLAIFSSND